MFTFFLKVRKQKINLAQTRVLVKNRDPWATYLQVSVAKEGNVLEQKKILQPLLGSPEGI